LPQPWEARDWLCQTQVSAQDRGEEKLDSYIEQYHSKHGGVTLRTWTEVQGWKKENFYSTGVSGTPVPLWFREVLREKHLADIIDFPYIPSGFYE
jgi:hypothetical protein